MNKTVETVSYLYFIPTVFNLIFKQTLKDQLIQEWSVDIENSNFRDNHSLLQDNRNKLHG